jgi:hypothetical protein
VIARLVPPPTRVSSGTVQPLEAGTHFGLRGRGRSPQGAERASGRCGRSPPAPRHCFDARSVRSSSHSQQFSVIGLALRSENIFRSKFKSSIAGLSLCSRTSFTHRRPLRANGRPGQVRALIALPHVLVTASVCTPVRCFGIASLLGTKQIHSL